MSKLAIAVIRRLGRYAALLVLPVVAAVAYLWLSVFDAWPIVGAVGLIVVGPLAMAAIALAIGVVCVPSLALPEDRLSRERAPRLWALWDEIDPPGRGRRILVVDDALNASMGERRGPLGLGRTEILTLGLPLLLVLDEPAARAVVAHEAGHARLKHSSGLANVGDFVGAFDMLFHHADPDGTVTGALAYNALSGGLRRLTREMRAISRRQEFEADAYAGPRREEMARALVLIKAADHTLDELVDRPIERALLVSASPPDAPVAMTLAALPEIHRRGVTATALLAAPGPSAEQQEDEALYGSTHPEFGERLKSLGFAAPPEVAPVAAPASATLLSPELFDELMALFERRWSRLIRLRAGES